MLLEIQRLINSEFDMLEKVGWLLYNREDQVGGLSKDGLNELLQIIREEEMYKECKLWYDEGFNDAICE